ncbi:major facilitator-type transporter ecdD [Colletotrichum liriopes]|uniref:Major facilitator-type transporter ecdD n=1 Tax=Colletotrichum liriopes TaxID=708192 RepID=A0AA37GIZ3_9PEZI|nr:major facilitator-type transporter ecdD [Colletotrichum liriopes]
MNSLALIGKFLGTIIVGPLTERLGHKKTMLVTCATQIIGVIIQVTSKHPAQYTVGRVIIYTAVGLVENVVPTYQTEISPSPLRGFFVGSIQLFLTFGSLIAGIVNNSMSYYTTDAGWIIATALQVLPAVIILAGIAFTPDRSDDALKELRKLRRKEDIDSGLVEFEIAALQEEGQNVTKKDGWLALFNSKNRRRTGIAVAIMALQQLTGVTFSSSYGPTFYKQVGLGSMAFAYAAINNGVSVVTAIIGMLALDAFGRRDVTFWGNLIQALFLCLIGGLGSKPQRSPSETNGMVASFILYAAALHATLGPAAYITAAEIGTASLREKTMALATAVNVVVGFVVVFTTPYLLSAPYANLGPNLGYVWGGFAALGAVWVWFCMPELKGRNLEEIDQLFEANIPAWKFASYETTGMSHDFATHENNNNTNIKAGLAEHKEQMEEAEAKETSTIQVR